MKWIKASEELPDNINGLHFRDARTKQPIPYRDVSKFASFDNYFLRFWNTQADIKTIEYHHIEYLDETPDNVQDSEQGEDELRKVINDFGIENGELKQEIQKHLDFIEKLKADINTFYGEEFEYKKEIQRKDEQLDGLKEGVKWWAEQGEAAQKEIQRLQKDFDRVEGKLADRNIEFDQLQSENKALKDRVKELEDDLATERKC